ncbi:hypothetical protein [Pseudosporangium ferrugineum]|uniref:Uncharacterized protein n=1 Tax=Pseudosporangium ferrugineum TaxID=439699 RepID=A0A2T0RWS6_9ACTN|nr:hypothetical protein [Pseudosporangium ferrugineum]PRY25646.1 hypothetical protein CLV70_11212 [Pseudosporangium ferrugineum]
MSEPMTLPADRDLPPGRAARMRGELLRAARGRPRRSRRWLPALAAAVVVPPRASTAAP